MNRFYWILKRDRSGKESRQDLSRSLNRGLSINKLKAGYEIKGKQGKKSGKRER